MSEYLNAEKLRLRAERAETLVHGWRRAGLALVALLALQLWLVVDATVDMRHQRENARQVMAQAQALEAQTVAASANFQRCKAANTGLVEGLREQQALLNEAIALAKRCAALQPSQWVLLNDR